MRSVRLLGVSRWLSPVTLVRCRLPTSSAVARMQATMTPKKTWRASWMSVWGQVPSHSLSWHYRCRHESLIAFSNHRYSDSSLITFPAAETRASAVEWRRVEGVYAKGKGRYNQAEAE